MDFLQDLNSQQVQAVTAGLGQVLVLAGPGSGKTRVLIRRAAYLIQSMGARPSNILAVTFTNKAAREMHRRLESLLGGQVEGLWLGTFHSACARILRREVRYLPFEANFVIFDADDQLALVRRIIKDLNLDDKQFRPGSIHAAISDAKNNLVKPEDYVATNPREDVVARVYQQYQKQLQESNAVDFDDLLFLTVQLLDQYPLLREQYARRFEHVLVDEFQDTNLAQYQLLKHFAAFHNNIFVVGDEDQSIYRWRGADYRNVLRFEEDYPNSQKILLEENYRSTQVILDAAMAVINQNRNRTAKYLLAARGMMGDKLQLYEAEDDRSEALFVVDTIRRSGRPHSDFAVMYRTNAQSRLLEEAFMKAGMSYRLVGAQRFYGRREVKDLIAYLRLVYNPDDEISLLRVINIPRRKIGAQTVSNLQQAARQTAKSMGQVLTELAQEGDASVYWGLLSGRGAAKSLADFGALLLRWRAGFEDLGLPGLFDRILLDIDYQGYLEGERKDGEDSVDRWENVQELRRMAYEYQERGIVDFLENLALVSDQDTIPEQLDAPTLLTLHAAKGLEFPCVFISGLDDGLLPHSRSLFDQEEMAEERRLFYVGLTRAQDRIYLVRAERRAAYGAYEDTEPCRFLQDIPADLVQQKAGAGFSRKRLDSAYFSTRSSREELSRWESVSRPTVAHPVVRAVIEPEYKPGMRVRHDQWGDGIVLDSRLQDNEEMVDVVFESVGLKRLLAAMAKLQILH